MPQEIYFGKVEIMHIKTGQKQTIENCIYNEHDSLNDRSLLVHVLKTIHKKERPFYVISKLCFESAKSLGKTND